MKQRLIVAACLVMVCLQAAPLLAADTTHIADNGLLTQIRADGIDVYARPGAIGADYFCAAADIARSKLSAPDRAWLEITRPLPLKPRQGTRRSVGFTLTPPGPPPARHRMILWPYRAGATLKVWVALAHCRVSENDPD